MSFERIDDRLEFDRENHVFRLDGREVPSVTQIIKAAGLMIGMVNDEYARERGSAVHLATAYYDAGVLNPEYLDSGQVGYLEAWDDFCRDHVCRWDAIEKIFYSGILQFAGIIDRFGSVDGEQAVVEIKTGQLYPWVAIQLQLQAELLDMSNIRRIAVRLFPDGKYCWQEYDDPGDRRVAMSALTITHWKRRNLK